MFEWWQILLLTLYSAYQIIDELHRITSVGSAVFAGMFTGLVMGDVVTGLFIGGSMQLAVLGVSTFGGASRIDANSGTIVATAFAVGAGMDPEQALAAIGVPVAALLVYADILARLANTTLCHLCDADVERMSWRAFGVHFWLGAASWMLSRCLPVFLALAFGQEFVGAVVGVLNGELAWLGTGLTIAGSALPAVGFAILLRNLPAKKHVTYLILGFTITALLSTVYTSIATIAASAEVAGSFKNLSMLAIALLGLALAMQHYKNLLKGGSPAIASAAATQAVVEEDEEDEL